MFGVSFAESLSKSATPRGLRWSSEATHEHGMVEKVFESKDITVQQILVPEEDEQELASQCCYFFDEEVDEHFDIIVQKLEVTKKKGRVVRKRKNQAIGNGQKKDFLDPRQVMYAITELVETMGRIETTMQSIAKKIDRLEERFEKHVLPKSEAPVGNSAHEKDANNMDEKMIKKLPEDGNDDIELLNMEEDAEKRDEDLSSPCKDKGVEKTEQRKMVSKRIKNAGDPEKTSKLFSWLESDTKDERVGLTGDPLQKGFFWKLLEPQIWLSSQHLDQSLYLLRKFLQENTDNCKSVVILDNYWGRYISNFWNRHNKGQGSKKLKILLNYYLGSLPATNGTAWEEGKIIYAPFHVDGRHCVALQIDLTEWVVHVYDCNVDLTRTKSMEESLEPVTHGLLLVLKNYEPMVKQLEKYGEKPLNFTRVDGLKQDKQGGDCGVYTLKYIDVLSTKKFDISAIEDEFIGGYRSYLAVSIWNGKWDSF